MSLAGSRELVEGMADMEELEAAYGLPAVLYPIHVMALGKPPPFTYDYEGILRLREHFIPHLEGISRTVRATLWISSLDASPPKHSMQPWPVSGNGIPLEKSLRRTSETYWNSFDCDNCR